MNIFRKAFEFLEDIHHINREFIDGVKNIPNELKEDLIKDLKKENKFIGGAIEKGDRAITSLKNVAEHLPDLTPQPFDPNPKLKKKLKKQKRFKKVKVNGIVRGAHLKVDRSTHSHHAIALNELEVIHYQDKIIKIDSIESFTKGDTIIMVDSYSRYSTEEIIDRAFFRLGEEKYNVVFDNCEHFVKWVLNGPKLS